MPRMSDWEREIHDARRREGWTLSGPNRIVKVTALSPGVRTGTGGYITIGRYLVGKSPHMIQTALGLPAHWLDLGARIYKLARLPLSSEYTYELTAYYPDGLAYNPAFGNPDYRPGSRNIHQWQIKPGIEIPVEPGYLELMPGNQLSYEWLLD